ncbi:MAG: imidazole glycerol phosphate synthase, glutamine amidotransferase subunit [Candidatus Schekmanbacteria bacterium RBG_16_38_10]|uniref:Imidazole glycerol phosphate synthase subunit HisH n=1 Tax=Candidatus Schekmanbacteria bacterium RBG_16_38_10 TaxID=1817879 RepID=A0A1F7RZY1_9BACT|nr:MAG: imidazole glycerol phosphate synthase, glutamine amidotransferase subunit [Candidatus Schekmanbacteria bacterium RBG_16_38_10]
MIGIIDYGLGNVKAFANVYKMLDIPAIIVTKPHELINVSRVIMPGVGAFDHAMKCLQDSGMREMLDEIVLRKQVPVLGICVGMQMLTNSSEEGVSPGLKWINGDVKKIDSSFNKSIYVPHMGWNDVKPLNNNDLFRGLSDDARFYFLHSYYVHCQRNEDVIAVTNYGVEFACAVNHENVFGVQFHPEKSHQYGIKLLKNFSEL